MVEFEHCLTEQKPSNIKKISVGKMYRFFTGDDYGK